MVFSSLISLYFKNYIWFSYFIFYWHIVVDYHGVWEYKWYRYYLYLFRLDPSKSAKILSVSESWYSVTDLYSIYICIHIIKVRYLRWQYLFKFYSMQVKIKTNMIRVIFVIFVRIRSDYNTIASYDVYWGWSCRFDRFDWGVWFPWLKCSMCHIKTF